MNVMQPPFPEPAPRQFPHVLIVEDDRAAAHLIRAVVLRHGHGCSATVVHDGTEAVRYFAGEEAYRDREIHPYPDLVILDLGLPGMDGFEVLAWLDGQAALKDTPIVVFSGSADPASAERAYALGARAFLPKSADPVRLAVVVSETLARWTPKQREGTTG